jgi:hypothetical protein
MTVNEKMKRRLLMGIPLMILLVVFSLIFTDFSHTCQGIVFYTLCMVLFITIAIYLCRNMSHIGKIFPFFILLFMLITCLWRVYDNRYCDVHISTDGDILKLIEPTIILIWYRNLTG